MSNKPDGQLDRLLTAIHRRDGTAASADCLDAETLAAWMDGQLGGALLARAEAHAAGCAYCQSLLAAMARTADTTSEAPAAKAAPRSKFWRMLPWAGPLTAAATAAAIYVAVRPPTAGPDAVDYVQPAGAARPVQSPPQTAGKSPPSAAPIESAPSRLAPSASSDRRAALPSDARARADGRPEPAPREKSEASRADARLEEKEGRQKKAATSTEARTLADTAPLPRVGEMQSLPAAPPPAPAPAAKPQSPAPSPRMEVAGSAAASYADANKAGRGAVATAVGGPSTFAPLLISTPDPAIRWRILGGSVVQLSRDAGRTWTAQEVGQLPAPLTAGAAASPTVCWIVGRAGTVLRTVDGRTWQRLAFPESIDLTRILATSADTATVTTADGRTFATTDGGKTWRLP